MTSLRSLSARARGLALAAALGALAWPGAGGAGLDPARLETWNLPRSSLFAVTSRGASVWAAGYWGTVMRSTDGGRTFSRAETPTSKTLFAVSFADEQNGWAVGAGGTVLRTTDGGVRFEKQLVTFTDEMGQSVPLDVNLFGVAALSPTVAWAVGDFGAVLRTRDGETWERLAFDATVYADDNVPERILNAVVFTSPTEGLIAGEFATLLRTTDGGETWVGTREIRGAPADLYLFSLYATAGGPAAAVGLAGSVLVSSEAGAVWESRSVETSAGLFAVAWSGARGIAAGDRGVLYVTQDGGATWQDAKRPKLFNWLAGAAFTGANEAVVVGEAGLVLRSEDGGVSWKAVVSPADGAATEPPLKGLGGDPTPPRPSGQGERE